MKKESLVIVIYNGTMNIKQNFAHTAHHALIVVLYWFFFFYIF